MWTDYNEKIDVQILLNERLNIMILIIYGNGSMFVLLN